MLFEPFFREDTYEKDIKSYIKSDKKGESTLDKQKFFSTLLTTVVIILTTFFVLTSDIHIILGAAIVGVGVMVSESLSKKIFVNFKGQNVSPATAFISLFLLLIVALYFVELYS